RFCPHSSNEPSPCYNGLKDIDKKPTDKVLRIPGVRDQHMPRDYYEVLGLKRGATDDEIKRAYRHLAREHHPDRNPADKGAESRFKEVKEAYDVLSDKTKRSQYDHFGQVGGQPGPNGPEGFHFGGGFGEGGGFDPSQIEDFLRRSGIGDVFGQRRQGGRSRR